MDDLDAMLALEADDTAAEMLPTVFDLDGTLKEKKIIDDVKPWLAFSSNAPAQKRDAWTKMVKVDALAELLPVCKPSNVYYSWEKPGGAPVHSGDKLLQEVVRSAASAAGLDDAKINKLMSMANPVADQARPAALLPRHEPAHACSAAAPRATWSAETAGSWSAARLS